MVVGLLGNESSDLNRLTLVTPKSENDVRLQATLDNQNPTGLPVGVVSNHLTQDIIDLYHIQIPIQDIDEAVKMFGGRVEEDREKYCKYCDFISKERDSFAIYISPYYKSERRKMIIAQQLGHLFLHMGYQTNHDLWNHQKEGRFQEKNNPEQARQANSFAFALLMPEKEYRKMIDLNSEGLLVQTKNIAEYFGVSLAAAAQRGRGLNILT